MSKFKKGDTVRLSPKSGWVDAYSIDPNCYNPLNVEGVIDEVDEYNTGNEYGVMWSNGKHNNCYTDHDLILVVKEQEHECPYAVIEELQAHVETLEEALEKVTKELIELREKQSVSTDTAFKPISEVTIKDWVLAKEEAWVFEDGTGEFFIVVDIDLADIYPIKCNDGNHYTLNGAWDNDVKGSIYDLKQRIK